MTFRFLPPEESFLGSVCSSLFVTRATLSDYHSAVTFNLHAPALHSGSFRAHPSVPSGQASVIPSVLAPPAPVRAASAPGRCWPSPTMDASGVQGAHLAGVGAGGINQLGGGVPGQPPESQAPAFTWGASPVQPDGRGGLWAPRTLPTVGTEGQGLAGSPGERHVGWLWAQTKGPARCEPLEFACKTRSLATSPEDPGRPGRGRKIRCFGLAGGRLCGYQSVLRPYMLCTRPKPSSAHPLS